MKRLLSIAIISILILGLLAGCGTQEKESGTVIRMGLLKGPTGIGAARLMEQSEKGESKNKYEFTLSGAPTDIVSAVASGGLDIAALPLNVASALYNKTNGGVKVAALNTAGVLYILEKGDEIMSIEDLAGKTLYATGQGSTPEFVLNYILTQNGLDGKVKVEYLDSEELATRAASGDIDICMLPVPNVTSVMAKNRALRKAIDLNNEWDRLQTGSIISMGCVVIAEDFLNKHPDAVELFLEEYRDSINYVVANAKLSGELCEKYGIVGSAAIAEKAIPDSSLIFMSGSEMKEKAGGFLNILFDADPTSIGGKLPDENFYLS